MSAPHVGLSETKVPAAEALLLIGVLSQLAVAA